jgi:Tol biopolymer transport system component
MIFDSGENVFVNSFPVPAQPHRVSIDNGTQPRWQADGKAINFVSNRDGHWMLARASFQAQPLRTGIPETIFEFASDIRSGTWSADGSRLLATFAVAPPRDNTVTVVLNWERLLEKADR